MRKFVFNTDKRRHPNLDVDDILVDSLNLSKLDTVKLEGKFTSQISPFNLFTLLGIVILVFTVFLWKLFSLQILMGNYYKQISESNTLSKQVIFAKRGVIKDRFGELLAYNSELKNIIHTRVGDLEVFKRVYNKKYKGISHILGYVKYPQTDKNGHLWREKYQGVGGVEEFFNDILNGKNGIKLVEQDANGDFVSSGKLKEPKDGEMLQLSIDARLNDALYRSLNDYLPHTSFKEGAAAIMDIQTGELIALTSVPDYDLNLLASGDKEYLKEILRNKTSPLIDRAIMGQYAPGSIVKPFVALAALNEKIIKPDDKLLSTGALKLPNPYNPDKPTIFKDWKAHGWINMKEALAYSSDEYFYKIGGGYKNQVGLGIKRILKYARLFGFGEKRGVELPSESAGLVPSPKWKKEIFGAPWNIGDTYHTSIGQYGFLITVLQAVDYVASVANGGNLLSPTIIKNKEVPKLNLGFSVKDINVIHDGMRMATNIGTARPLKLPEVAIAAKTGTAQTGIKNERKNSWVIGFWPYKKPRFAFAAMLSRGDEHDTGSASHAMRDFFLRLIKENSSYVQGIYPKSYKKNDAKDDNINGNSTPESLINIAQ